MAQTIVKVASSVGLHARPAYLVSQKAAELEPAVLIKKVGSDEEPVEAASVLGLMSLGAHNGDEVELTAEGPGADEAVAAIADLIAQDLDAQ
jgi:phosphocarrier protein